MDDVPDHLGHIRRRAWLDAAEREFQQGLQRSRPHIRGLNPERHQLATDVAEALARCGLWLGDSHRPGGGGVGISLPGPEVTEEVYVGWKPPEASTGAAFESRAQEIMLHALAELLELMDFHVDDGHTLPARGVKGLIVSRKAQEIR